MKRLLFNLLAGLSLLLCIATAALWVRSCRWIDSLDFNVTWNASPKLRGSQISLDSGAGHVGFSLTYDCLGPHRAGFTVLPRTNEPLYARHICWPRGKYAWAGEYATQHWFGFYHASAEGGVFSGVIFADDPTFITHSYGISDWPIILLTAIAPAILLLRKLRHRKPLPGHCSVCGYNLRTTPDRCPECGTPVQAKQDATP
jgi:hypothetical protein